MRTSLISFLYAAFWPITVWPSLARLKKHASDDFIGRSSPIIAFAIAFWACVAGLVLLYLSLQSRMLTVTAEGIDVHLLFTHQGWQSAYHVALLFTPLIYAIGFWLFTMREAIFPRYSLQTP